MASSGYWYRLYKKEKALVNQYEGNIRDLNRIHTNVKDDLADEISSVNNKKDDLWEKLKKGIRHDAIFTSRADELHEAKEKTADKDPNISKSVLEIEEEITRLERLKEIAEENRDEYYRRYLDALEEEDDD